MWIPHATDFCDFYRYPNVWCHTTGGLIYSSVPYPRAASEWTDMTASGWSGTRLPFWRRRRRLGRGPATGEFRVSELHPHCVHSHLLDIIYYFLPLPILHSLKLRFTILFYLRHISVSLLHISFEHYFIFYRGMASVLNCVDIR